MSVEHRIQHAARELREVPIEVPPLARPGRERPGGRPRLVPALAAPMLFVAGGLFTLGAGTDHGGLTHSDVDAVGPIATDVDPRPGERDTAGITQTRPQDFELELLEQLIVEEPVRPATDTPPRVAPSAVTGGGPI